MPPVTHVADEGDKISGQTEFGSRPDEVVRGGHAKRALNITGCPDEVRHAVWQFSFRIIEGTMFGSFRHLVSTQSRVIIFVTTVATRRGPGKTGAPGTRPRTARGKDGLKCEK